MYNYNPFNIQESDEQWRLIVIDNNDRKELPTIYKDEISARRAKRLMQDQQEAGVRVEVVKVSSDLSQNESNILEDRTLNDNISSSIEAATGICMEMWYNLTQRFNDKKDKYDPKPVNPSDQFVHFRLQPGSDIEEEAYKQIIDSTESMIKRLNKALKNPELFKTIITKNMDSFSIEATYAQGKGGLFKANTKRGDTGNYIELAMPKQQIIRNAFKALLTTPSMPLPSAEDEGEVPDAKSVYGDEDIKPAEGEKLVANTEKEAPLDDSDDDLDSLIQSTRKESVENIGIKYLHEGRKPHGERNNPDKVAQTPSEFQDPNNSSKYGTIGVKGGQGLYVVASPEFQAFKLPIKDLGNILTPAGGAKWVPVDGPFFKISDAKTAKEKTSNNLRQASRASKLTIRYWDGIEWGHTLGRMGTGAKAIDPTARGSKEREQRATKERNRVEKDSIKRQAVRDKENKKREEDRAKARVAIKNSATAKDAFDLLVRITSKFPTLFTPEEDQQLRDYVEARAKKEKGEEEDEAIASSMDVDSVLRGESFDAPLSSTDLDEEMSVGGAIANGQSPAPDVIKDVGKKKKKKKSDVSNDKKLSDTELNKINRQKRRKAYWNENSGVNAISTDGEYVLILGFSIEEKKWVKYAVAVKNMVNRNYIVDEAMESGKYNDVKVIEIDDDLPRTIEKTIEKYNKENKNMTLPENYNNKIAHAPCLNPTIRPSKPYDSISEYEPEEPEEDDEEEIHVQNIEPTSSMSGGYFNR